MFSLEQLGDLGKVAGIAGLAIGAFVLVFNRILRRAFLAELTQRQSFYVIVLIVVLAWSIAVAGILTWYLDRKLPTELPNMSTGPLQTGTSGRGITSLPPQTVASPIPKANPLNSPNADNRKIVSARIKSRNGRLHHPRINAIGTRRGPFLRRKRWYKLRLHKSELWQPMKIDLVRTTLILFCVTFLIERSPTLAETCRAEVGPNCSVEGGQNLGVIIQTCAPKTALVSAPDDAQSAPVQLPDGTYTHNFIYQAPIGQRFITRICGAEIVGYSLKGLVPLSEISFEGSEGRHCNIKEYFSKISPITLDVRTRTASLKFAIQTSIVQSVGAGQLVAAVEAQHVMEATAANTPPPPMITTVTPPIMMVPVPTASGGPAAVLPSLISPR